MKEVCKDPCKDAEKNCEWIEYSPSERRKAYRERKHIRKLVTAYIVVIALIITSGVYVVGYLNDILLTQYDVMDKLHELELTEEAQIEPTAYYNLTDEERNYIERVVASESRGEPYEGILAVAQVVRDRATLWNMPISEVLGADRQFASPYKGEVSEDVKMAVNEIFDNGTSHFAEPVTHFHSGQEPYWTAGKVNRGTIGNHQFYY